MLLISLIAILTALDTKKPVYIEIACNISILPVSPPAPMEFIPGMCKSDPQSLESAVKEAASLLNTAVKPVLVAGVKLRSSQAIEDFEKLIKVSHYAVAAMPNAKGFISEQNPNYIGVYWGPVSTPACGEIIDSSDLYLFAGPHVY
jgi:pyruvate decarboxylase